VPQETLDYVQAITGRSLFDWRAPAYTLIAADAGTTDIAISRNSGSNWVEQVPLPGAVPSGSVSIFGDGAHAVAVGGASSGKIWTYS